MAKHVAKLKDSSYVIIGDVNEASTDKDDKENDQDGEQRATYASTLEVIWARASSRLMAVANVDPFCLTSDSHLVLNSSFEVLLRIHPRGMECVYSLYEFHKSLYLIH